MQPCLTIITVILEDREDGGLRGYSDDLPGLIMSGRNRNELASRIAPAIKVLLEHKGFRDVTVRPARAVNEVLQLGSPHDVNMHVRHEQFVVEMQTAA